MNKLFYSVAIIFVIACSSDNEGLDPHLIAPELAITELIAIGSVAEQTIAQAKKTIYGKWDIVNSGRSYSNTTKSNACAFDFIEFTDDAYLMALIVDGDRKVTFGTYDMNEDASGNVTSVDLNFNLGTTEVTIATLTNIVVVANGDNLSATFSIELNIPDEADFDACNALEGDYFAAKDDPMEGSESATADTNHAKIIKSWTLVSSVYDGKNQTSEIMMEPCLEDNYSNDEEQVILGCTPATSLTVSFSTFGTYSFVFLGSSEGTWVETDGWAWTSDAQTSFYVGGEGTEGNEQGLITIVSLTDTSLEVTSDDGTVWTFVAQ